MISNFKFRTVYNEQIDDVVQYVQDYVNSSHDKVQVFVGCDSKEYRKHTIYVLAICMYRPGKGAHVIYAKKRIESSHEVLFNRMWKEVELTIELSLLLRDKVYGVEIEPHFDINPNDRHGSYVAYKGAAGYAQGAGFNTAKCKPQAFAASYAADRLTK